MGRLNLYGRTRLINLRESKPGISIQDLCRRLEEEDGIKISRQSVAAFLKRYDETGMVTDQHRNGRVPKLKPEHFDFIDEGALGY